MLDVALKLLEEITNKNYKAYIIGGFVRDYLLGIESSDIDITTNATPKQIKEIFEDSCLPNEDYGSVTVIKKGIRFEITTFRKEIGYLNNRKPAEVRYIDDLYEDLLRRDFIINTLCMDVNGEVIDYLGGREDIKNRTIRSIGDSNESFLNDSLRMLRAIRFATILDFSLSVEVEDAIIQNRHLLKNLSFYRKREELDKIFTSSNYKRGIKLLLDLGLEEYLDIPNLSKLLNTDVNSLIGIWSVLNVTDKYPFNKNELELIKSINNVLPLNNIDPYVLYQYGLYVNSIAYEIKNLDVKEVHEAYNDIEIKSRSEIDIDSSIIMSVFNSKPGKYIKDIYNNIEKEILYHRLKNKKEDIIKYILRNYKRRTYEKNNRVISNIYSFYDN